MNIKNYTLKELAAKIKDLKEPSYRAGQIFDWIYHKNVSDFRRMTTIPLELRNKLKSNFESDSIAIADRLKSSDGTQKYLFRLADGNLIEAVLIHSRDRNTLCLSTQVGCKFSCAFCASGMVKFKRNLSVSEIIDQILTVQAKTEDHLTNFVFMGMGEPLDNYDNLTKAIEIMNDPKGMEIAARRITISTVGIVPGIERLGSFGLQVNLSISLHATNNPLRNNLVPISRKYPLKNLTKACVDYFNRTGRKITLEYIMLKGINDSPDDAKNLADIARKLKAKVNLISFNEVPGIDFEPTPENELEYFKYRIMNKKISVTLRKSSGGDIHASCGQLAGKKIR